jgi:hypothetical protein
MSEDERQLQMDFILNALAKLTMKLDGLTERADSLTANVDNLTNIQRADAVRIGRLEEAFVTLKQLSERIVERLDEHDARTTAFENAIVMLTRLVEQRNGEA